MENKGTEFYNILMKSWLQDKNIEKHSTHDEGKSAIAERFGRILKNKVKECTPNWCCN